MSGEQAQSLREQGAALLRENRFADAAQVLAEAVAVDPADEGAWRLLGGARASVGDTMGAITAFEQALTLRPELAKNHYNLALALQANGDIAGARRRLLQALEVDPTYEQAHLRLAELEPAPPPVSAVPPPPPLPTAPPPRYVPAPGGYTPPPALGAGIGQAQRDLPAPPMQNDSPLILSIIGLIGGLLCFLPGVCSPIALAMANNALRQLNENYPHATAQINNLKTARILGIIGTVLFGLMVLGFLLLVLIGVFAD